MIPSPATATPCPECGTAARGPAVHGTRLVLCPVCWRVLDPTAPPAPPPRPDPLPLSTPEEWPDTYRPETPPLPPPRPRYRRPVPLPADDELAAFGYVPRSYPGPLFPRWMLFYFAVLLGILAVGFSMVLHQRTYPGFETHTDPSGRYTAAFPARPNWEYRTGRVGAPADAVATRDAGTDWETYRVSVSGLDRPPFRAWRPLEVATTLANRRYPPPDRVRPVSSPPGGDGAAEYERREADTRYRVVGRVVVVGNLVYELTVSGRGVALNDWRVQRFFDSFRPRQVGGRSQ